MAAPRCSRWLTCLGAVSLAGAVAAGTAGGVAAASSGHSKKKARPIALPGVKDPTNLSVEPVIRAGHGKPPTRLLIKNLVVGTGTTVTAASSVSVVYVGANWKNGRDFTVATWRAHTPTSFSLSGVVRGFAEGLVGMKVGGRREIVIPPALGYGRTGGGPIKPNETLVFVVDLKGVTG